MSASFAKPLPLLAILAILCLAPKWATGQTNTLFNVAGPATWNSNANWTPAFVPDVEFNEIAVIGSGRSAFVADTPATPGGIIIDSGTLEIRSTGSLTSAPGTLATGDLAVGGAGVGTLLVRRGGTLNVQNVTMGANAANQITLGETAGSGNATFMVTGGELSETTQIIGPNVNFSSSGDLDFSGGTLAPVITGGTHSAINVAGTANLGGSVKPQFSGYTPAVGNSWNLVTAAQLTGAFTLDTSLTPPSPRGTGYYLNQTSITSTLKYSNLLLLTVDRGNGATSIQNVVGSPISFEGYTINSPSGVLGGSWNSLQDQGIASWDEADNSNASRLTEFKTSGATSVNVGGSLSLGNPFSPPVPSGLGIQPGGDLLFQYAVPGEGTIDGIVEYTGRRNNLVLTINSTTGAAAIQNESTFFDAAIDAYTITSASGRLLVANGSWNSLDDQNLGNWDQADNSNANRITEFNTQGTTAMPGGGAVLNLGTPISTAGGPLNLADFTFEYAISNPLGGDYNSDGIVDAADYTVWRDKLGSSTSLPNDNTPGVGTDDYTRWKANFGNAGGTRTIQGIVAFGTLPGSGASGTGLVAVSAVPEPSSLSCLVLLVSIFAASRAFPSFVGRCART